MTLFSSKNPISFCAFRWLFSFFCFFSLFILNAFSQRLKVRRLNLSYIHTLNTYVCIICLLFRFIHSQLVCASISSAMLSSSSMLMMTKDTREYHQRRFLFFLILFLSSPVRFSVLFRILFDFLFYVIRMVWLSTFYAYIEWNHHVIFSVCKHVSSFPSRWADTELWYELITDVYTSSIYKCIAYEITTLFDSEVEEIVCGSAYLGRYR